MNIYRFFCFLLIWGILSPVFAQNRGKVRTKIVKSKEEVSPRQKLYQSMLPATAKVMFIDSFVVDKDNFISHIPLSPEMGHIAQYSTFYKTNKGVNGSVFENELKTTIYYSLGDTLHNEGIFVSHKLGDDWSKPQIISEISNEYQEANYPFLLSDGNTMFFGAKGENSIGGYDIFITKKDYDTNKFYQPENYGLPFNSPANDYFIALDEINGIGYLVSDRYQVNNNVCVYVFIPTKQREGLENEHLTESELKDLASLKSIKSTWKFGDIHYHKKKFEQLIHKKTIKEVNTFLDFRINDNVVYTNLTQCKSDKSTQLIKLWKEKIKEYENLSETLSKVAQVYIQGNKQVRTDILRHEEKLELLRLEIIKLEKEIRRIEN